MRARAPAALAVLLLVAIAVTPATALTELDDARERREAIEERLGTVVGDVEGLEEAIHAGEQQLAALDDEEDRLRAELADVEAEIEARTRLAFMRGEQGAVQLLVTGDDPADVAERAALLASLTLRDRAAAEEAATLRAGLAQNRQLQEGRLVELEEMRADLARRVAILEEDLEQARQDERFFELQARRQREVDTSFMSGIYACPVDDPVVFRDTWGAPRSGGRSHKGVDMFAQHGVPNLAIHSGRVTRMNNGGLGGISLYLWGDDGNQYYYTHLQGYAEGISVGSRVEAGDVVAFTGSTGNAAGGAPHTHFEVHPGGGAPVNPYPYAAAACGR